jgi:hypothetical protein
VPTAAPPKFPPTPVVDPGDVIMNEIRDILATDLINPSGWPDQPEFISDADLLRTFVTPQMTRYFQAKMPHLHPDILVFRVCELLKYLMLVQFSPGCILFDPEIDDLWHYWILQTRQYAQLCEKLPGEFFRHHSSAEYRETANVVHIAAPSEAMLRILSFFISYYRNFGPMTDDRVACWPTVRRVMVEARWDLSELNRFLCEMAFAPTSQPPCLKSQRADVLKRDEPG